MVVAGKNSPRQPATTLPATLLQEVLWKVAGDHSSHAQMSIRWRQVPELPPRLARLAFSHLGPDWTHWNRSPTTSWYPC
jgi:hypothetical protein